MGWTDHFQENERVFPIHLSSEARERIAEQHRQLRLRVLNDQVHRQRRA